MNSNELKMSVIERIKVLGLNVEEVGPDFVVKPGRLKEKVATVASPLIKNEMIEAAAKEDAPVNEVVSHIINCVLQGFEIQDSARSVIAGLSPDNLYITLGKAGISKEALKALARPCNLLDGVEKHLSFILNDGIVIPVTRDNLDYLLDKFKLSKESLWELALKNTCASATIRKLDGADGYIITSTAGVLGASAILHKEYIAEFAKSIGVKSFVLLPSSVHEIILVPVKPDSTPLPLPLASAMVQDGNKEIPDPSHILADRAYMYYV